MSMHTTQENNVLKTARQYARMKHFGTYVEGERIIFSGDREYTTKLFMNRLLRAAEELVSTLGHLNEKGEIEE